MNLPIKPEMNHGHDILSECSRFIGTDSRASSKSFYSLEILGQHFLLFQTFCSQGQRDRKCWEEAFRDIGDYNTNDKGSNGNNLDEPRNFRLERGFLRGGGGDSTSNHTDVCLITGSNHKAGPRPLLNIGCVESDILTF